MQLLRIESKGLANVVFLLEVCDSQTASGLSTFVMKIF
jgi:hypothetical protein